MRRSFAFAMLLAVLAAAGCAAGASSGNGAGDDTSTTGTPTPTATGTPFLYGGFAYVARVRVEVPATGTPSESGSADATFYVPYTIPGGAPGLPAVDQCTLSIAGATPTPTAVATPAYRSAGSDVTLTGASTFDMPMTTTATGYVYYPATIPAADIAGGSAWSLSWPGADVAAESFASAITMPAALSITSPDVTQVVTVGAGDLPVSWTGSGSGPAELILTVEASASDWGSILCEPADDGSFTIPGSLIAQLPSGTGTLGMIRMTSSMHALGDGSTLGAYGYWEHFGQVTKP